MTAIIVDDFSALWNADTGGLWELALVDGYLGASAMQITARNGAASDPAPSAQREFSPALDLSGYDELRFWLRSSRSGDGSPARPFYLLLEADSAPSTGAPWSRFIPVTKPNTWEMQTLWLADMPPDLRSAVDLLSIRSLDPAIAFMATLDSLIATRLEPIQDVETALHARLHERFQVLTVDGMTAIPAVFDVPEADQSAAMPYILIAPWSLERVPAERDGGEVIDNFTPQGAYVRPAAERLRLRYSMDVMAGERAQKASLFEQILLDLSLNTHLIVADERLEITSFAPAAELVAAAISARRTPIYCEVMTSMEVIPRQFQPWAVPLVFTAPLDGRETAELTIP